MDVRDAGQARLSEIITVAGAERVMAGARMAELVAAKRAAGGVIMKLGKVSGAVLQPV